MARFVVLPSTVSPWRPPGYMLLLIAASSRRLHGAVWDTLNRAPPITVSASDP